MPNYSETDWENIIYRGVESEELDYKAAINWRKLTRTGKSKFVRHCLAMANTKGGYVVVGVGEDSAGQPHFLRDLPRIRPNLSTRQLSAILSIVMLTPKLILPLSVLL